EDGYRFHDALHLGLLAVTGWSPVMRSLLGLKRRSDPIVDTIEDGGRAIVLEEGLFGFLGSDRQTYKDPFYNDADIEVATAQMWHKSRAVLPPGETIPYELWKKAIILGQNTLYRLVETIGTHAPQDEEPTKCAYLTADLDHQSLDLSFKPPEPLHNLLKP
ncbi:MAG TPA: hypothetical protein VD735_05110, partial [Candidatus Saccharimonadales bacterium]|nr:hypothetical protein [Candidatus Saccharimonadales bacterium]